VGPFQLRDGPTPSAPFFFFWIVFLPTLRFPNLNDGSCFSCSVVEATSCKGFPPRSLVPSFYLEPVLIFKPVTERGVRHTFLFIFPRVFRCLSPLRTVASRVQAPSSLKSRSRTVCLNPLRCSRFCTCGRGFSATQYFRACALQAPSPAPQPAGFIRAVFPPPVDSAVYSAIPFFISRTPPLSRPPSIAGVHLGAECIEISSRRPPQTCSRLQQHPLPPESYLFRPPTTALDYPLATQEKPYTYRPAPALPLHCFLLSAGFFFERSRGFPLNFQAIPGTAPPRPLHCDYSRILPPSHALLASCVPFVFCFRFFTRREPGQPHLFPYLLCFCALCSFISRAFRLTPPRPCPEILLCPFFQSSWSFAWDNLLLVLSAPRSLCSFHNLSLGTNLLTSSFCCVWTSRAVLY